MYGALLTMTPPPRTPKPAWAIAFKARRVEKVGSQEELALRADVSQSLISQIERGVQDPTGVSMDRFARLLEVMDWTPEQFTEDTGLDIPLALPKRPSSRFQPPSRRPERRPLWPNLAAMIAEKQKKHAPLREDRWQQYLNNTRFAAGREPDEEGWFEIYQSLRRHGVEPEEWPEE